MKLFAITDQQVQDYPVLEHLVWPDCLPTRTELSRYVITERHDNWAVLIMFATWIDDIAYDAEQIATEDRNRVNRMYIGRPQPKYTHESNCISKDT